MSGLRVLVPMRPLAQCKRRLAAAMPDQTREALVLMMLSRTVRAIAGEVGPAGCWVIGGDDWVKRVAVESGAIWLEDAETDLNRTLAAAMGRAYHHGAGAAMFVPVDLPLITSADVRAVIDASERYTRPAAVEAQADGGTNALLIPAGVSLTPALGQHSYQRHRTQAERIGVRFADAVAPGIAFDLDRPTDFAFACERISGFSSELASWELRLAPVNEPARAATRL